MFGLERADARSVSRVEGFLREQTGEAVVLDPVHLATGLLGNTVAALARARAITLGPLICVRRSEHEPQKSPEVRAALERFGSLFVHECVHVWQYRRDGAMPFLRHYMRAYFSGIWIAGSIRRAGRQRAYLAIPAEIEAFRLEQVWQQGAEVDARREAARGVEPEVRT